MDKELDKPRFRGRSVSSWIDDLADFDSDTRREAIAAIAELGPAANSAVPKLVALLDDPYDYRVLWALGRIGDSACIAPVLASLANVRRPPMVIVPVANWRDECDRGVVSAGYPAGCGKILFGLWVLWRCNDQRATPFLKSEASTGTFRTVASEILKGFVIDQPAIMPVAAPSGCFLSIIGNIFGAPR